jgi:hypothetical protein
MSPRNRDEAMESDEDEADLEPEFDTDPDDEPGDAYDRGFAAAERDARKGSRTENPYPPDEVSGSFGRWQDGYDDGGGGPRE